MAGHDKGDAVIREVNAYRKRHGWDASDSLIALAKSIYIEAVELLESLEGRQEDVEPVHAREELADVFMYAISLCIDLGVDYKRVVAKRIEQKKRSEK